MRLNHDKSIALKLHLNGFTAAAAEERLQRNVLFEFRRQVTGPGNSGVWISGHWLSRPDSQSHQLKMGSDRDQAGPQLDVEQSTGQHARDGLHILMSHSTVVSSAQRTLPITKIASRLKLRMLILLPESAR